MTKSTKTAATTPAAKITRNPANANPKTFTLAQLLADIHRDNKTATVTAKSARVRLRREFAADHTKNDAWTFSRRRYDAIRSMFDPAYAAKHARPARASKKASTPAPAPADA